MMTKKSSLKRPEMNEKARLTEKLTAVNGRLTEDVAAEVTRPTAVTDVISGRCVVTTEMMTVTRPKLTKLLLNVTVDRSLVPVHVVISPESTVGDLIAAALRQYSKEGRRPVIPAVNPPGFDLHYSQFCLERLSPDEKLNELGSRNFFLCSKQSETVTGSDGDGIAAPPLSSSTVLLRFMEFML